MANPGDFIDDPKNPAPRVRVYKFLSATYGMKSLYERRLKISQWDELNDPFEMLPFKTTGPGTREALRGTMEELVRSERGVLCFSDNWRNPTIWAHYADQHRGICLGFDIPEPTIERVQYKKTRERLPFPPNLRTAKIMLTCKFESWAYEKEVRTFPSTHEREAGIPYIDFGDHLTLVQVILGMRCKETSEGIIRALGEKADDIQIIQAKASDKVFAIEAAR